MKSGAVLPSYMNSFFPKNKKFWNDIDDVLRNSTSISKFKSDLFSLLPPPMKSIYGIHDPNGIKHIFRLRVGFSPLKSHKKRHTF